LKPSDYPKLHAGVTLQPLDSDGSVSAYLLTSPAGRRWQVTDSYRRFLLLLDGKRSPTSLQDELDGGDYPGLNGCRAADVLEKFVAPCGLLEDGGVASGRNPRRRSRLTIAIPLLSSTRLKFLTRLTRHAYGGGRAAIISVLLTGAAIQLASWYVMRSEWSTGQMPSGLADILLVVAIALACVPLHELGHLSACHRYECEAGVLGIGTYIVFPVMYVDLSAAWALPRMRRVVIDVGGIYFQFIGASLLGAAHLLTGKLAFGMLALGYLVSASVNLNPLMKLDGYWCLGDWVGIPNLHQEARQALWGSLASGLGRQTTARAISYGGWRRRFLITFGALHIVFMALVCWSILLLLPGVLWWLDWHHVTLFVDVLRAAPLSERWWAVVPRAVGHLLLSLGIMLLFVTSAVRLLTAALKAARRARRLGRRGMAAGRRVNYGGSLAAGAQLNEQEPTGAES
jgi:hypothetical protein